jgi:hypothetical protein
MWMLLVVTLVLVAGVAVLVALAIRSSSPQVADPEAGPRRAPRPAAPTRRSPEQAANSRRQVQLAHAAEARTRIDFTGADFSFDIVGESFYEENIRQLDGGRLAERVTVAFDALVVPDPANPFSKSGMAVMVAAEGVGPIGHFSEDDARRYRAVSDMLLSRGAVGACGGWLIGGRGDAPSIGARLSILSPEEILGTAEELRPVAKETSRPPKPELVYAGTACPYCGVDLVPPPKRKKKCTGCGERVLVLRAFDRRYHLMREADCAAFEAAQERDRNVVLERGWAAEEVQREAQLEADRARGVLIGEADLDVVGESRFKGTLGRIVGEVVEPDGWVTRACIARLVYDGQHERGPLVRVEIEGAPVGFLEDDDAEMYEDFLIALEHAGKPALVRATIRGKAGRYGVTLDDVPEP